MNLTNFLFDKISNYLKNKEGCKIETSEDRMNVMVVQDAMGFRYEVTIRLTGRTVLWTQEKEEILTQQDLNQIRSMK